MGRPFLIEITESEADLKKRLQQAREATHKEKLQMLWWLKSGQVTQKQEIGKRLGRDKSTVTLWLQKYRRGGLVERCKSTKHRGTSAKSRVRF